MLLDDETGKRSGSPEIREHSPSPGKSRSANQRVKVLSAMFAVALVGGISVVAKQYLDAASTPAPLTAPVILTAPTLATGSAKQKASANPATSAKPTKSANTPHPWASWPVRFDATFQGSHLDTSIWATCYKWASAAGCTNYGNTHDPELEWYRASQVQVSGGALHLIAKREPTPGTTSSGAPKEYPCRSGLVTTLPGFNFEYGYIQITAQIPFGRGLWPALWLGATNQKWPPEIDILEHWHNESYGKVYLHPLSGERQGGRVTEPGLATGWHTFGLYWTPTRLAWYYDGNQVFATSTGVPHQDMFLLMNVADDQDGSGSCSGSMNISSVKVWQQPK